jgi:hypothetical protein
MASQKFVFTVSGVELSEAQKAKISQEIAAVVTRAVLGESPKPMQPQLMTLHGVFGGKMIDVASAQRSPEKFFSTGCAGELE